MVHSLNCVTEFNFANTRSVLSKHLEQIALACPNLRHLNLQDNYDRLASLQGLRAIANYCPDL